MIKLNAFAEHIDTEEKMITPVLVNPYYIKLVTPYFEEDEDDTVVDLNKKPFGAVLSFVDEQDIRVRESVERVYEIIQEQSNPLGL